MLWIAMLAACTSGSGDTTDTAETFVLDALYWPVDGHRVYELHDEAGARGWLFENFSSPGYRLGSVTVEEGAWEDYAAHSGWVHSIDGFAVTLDEVPEEGDRAEPLLTADMKLGGTVGTTTLIGLEECSVPEYSGPCLHLALSGSLFLPEGSIWLAPELGPVQTETGGVLYELVSSYSGPKQ